MEISLMVCKYLRSFLMPSYETNGDGFEKMTSKCLSSTWRILGIQLSSAKQLFHTFPISPKWLDRQAY